MERNDWKRNDWRSRDFEALMNPDPERSDEKTILWIALIVISFLIGIYLGYELSKPRLIGYGCDGTSAAIYANEEDHFPLKGKGCDQIQSNQ